MRSKSAAIAKKQENQFKKIAIFSFVMLFSIFLLFVFFTTAKAQTTLETRAMNEVSKLLKDAHEVGGNQSQLTSIVKRHFAVGTWSHALLGKEKKNFSSSQLQEFNRLFPAYIAKQYFKQFGGSGQSAGETTGASTRRGDVLVTSKIPSNRRTFKVTWRMRVIGGKPRVIDYSTGGISNVVLRRSEFQSKVKKSGAQSLNDFLKAFIAS